MVVFMCCLLKSLEHFVVGQCAACGLVLYSVCVSIMWLCVEEIKWLFLCAAC